MRKTAFALMFLGLASPAAAIPLGWEGLEAASVQSVQFFRQRLTGDGPVTRPPGRNYPGRGIPGRRGGGRGALGWGAAAGAAGVLLPHLIDGMRPRPRGPVVVEEDYDDVQPRRPHRPRVRPERIERLPVARNAPPKGPPRGARPAPSGLSLPPVSVPVASEQRMVAQEVLIEVRSTADTEAVLQRYRLTQLGVTRFDLAQATILRARIEGGRTPRQVLRQMAGDARIASAQPNYLYTLQEDTPPAEAPKAALVSQPEPPPAPARRPQYTLEKLGVTRAQALATGASIKVALVDTGVDEAHPELNGAIAGRFDTLGDSSGDTREHGTAMAGALVARASLAGISPRAEVLAARAFGGDAKSTGTSFQIVQALDWAAARGARVFNLSFAGPRERLMARELEGAASRKIIAVGAMGNAGPGTPALYPAAEPSVLAVTATDAADAIFPRANTGAYVAIAAPGVDVIAAAPEGKYAFSSGTSIATAHVSGLVALMLEKNPDLDLAGVRRILADTAIDLGPRGADPVYGAGRADAAAAVAKAAGEAAPPR